MATTFFIVSAIDFNDIIAIMIFHYLRGSKPNQCTENWALFEKTCEQLAIGVLVTILLFPFSCGVAYLLCFAYLQDDFHDALRSEIFEEARVLLTNWTLNSILTN